jgi:hypothetical protein
MMATEPPVKGMTVIPLGANNDDPLMLIGWRDCLSWAIGKPEIQASFLKETGHNLSPLASRGINAMIDEACGRKTDQYRNKVILAFFDWATINLWGVEGVD